MNFRKNNSRFGFTLIELLVVISIIGILVGIGTFAFSAAQKRGRDAKRKADLQQIRSALEIYRADHNGQYPPAPNCCNDSSTLVRNALSTLVPQYISQLPDDPQCSGTTIDRHHCYVYDLDAGNCGTNYRLYTWLENTSDPQGTGSCGQAGGSQIENNRLLFMVRPP